MMLSSSDAGTYILRPDALYEKAILPIDGGVVALQNTSLRLEQLQKAPFPIVVILFGILIFVRLEQPLNA
jgi:hypothetical protein